MTDFAFLPQPRPAQRNDLDGHSVLLLGYEATEAEWMAVHGGQVEWIPVASVDLLATTYDPLEWFAPVRDSDV